MGGQTLDDWRLYRTRYMARHEFNGVIALIASDLGRDYLDVVRFRDRYYEGWLKQLREAREDYDLHRFVRQLVERALVDDVRKQRPVLPITGEDIMRELEVPPGRELDRWLRRAAEIYDANPCPGLQLLTQLKAEYVAL